MPASPISTISTAKLGIGLPTQPSKLVGALYARDRIPPSRHPQIAGFTARARRQAYQAQIRDLKTQYGYADTPVVLRDPAVLEQIALDASSAATSIINGYNSRLQSALETLDNLHKLRDTLSENDALLQPFRQGITDYNQDTLIPFQLKTARQAAIHDFMVNNGIQALYLVEPDSSVSPDSEICQQALAISNATDGKGAPFSAYAQLPGGGFLGEEHPNCFIAGTMVAGPLVETAFSRPYQGPLVTIRTAGGDELTGTPNHPILTPEGWVPLGLLAEGHDLFRCTDVERMAHLIDPDEHQVPSLIEDVLGAEPVTLLQVPAATTNFHGDGMPDGKVDVVFPNRLLHRHGTAQQHRELALIGAGAAKDFAGSGVTQKSFLGMPSASNGFVAAVDSFRGGSRSDPAAQQVFLEGALRYTSLGSQDGDRFPSQVATNERVSDGLQRSNAGLQPSMGDQPRSLQVSRQDFLADPDLLRHSFDRFPGLIATDQVLDVRHHDGDTHVYNTSTAEGWYAANNIIVSNCPHLLVPKEADPDTLPSPEGLWDGSEGSDDVTTSEDMGDVSSEKGFVGLVRLLGLGMKAFNPDEPRDNTGRWTAGEAAAAAAYAAQTARTVADLPKPGSITPEGIPWTGTDQQIAGAQGPLVENVLSGVLAQRSGGKLTQHDAAYFQSFWSKDSTFPASVALEQAVGEKFGIPANQRDAALREESAKIVDYAPFYGESQWNVGGWDGLLAKARAYVDAQYSLTQDMLKARGITEVEAYRGTKADEVPSSVAKEHDRVHDNYVPPMPDPSTGEVTYDPPKPDYLPVPITASPVSSWSASEGVANKFATDYGTSSGTFGLLQRAVIPASRVLAAAYTGSGSSDEYEYLIIGAAEPISVGMKLADDYVYRKRTGLGMVQKSEERSPEENAAIHAWYGDQATATAALGKIMSGARELYDKVMGQTKPHWGIPLIQGDTPAGRELYGSMKLAAEAKGYKVFRDGAGGYNGYCDPDKKEIHINASLPGDQQAKTLAHEVAHAYAGHDGDYRLFPAEVAKQELEAESAAFTLAQQHGLDTSTASVARLLGEGSRFGMGYSPNSMDQAIHLQAARDRATRGLRTKFNHLHDELGRFAAAAGEPIPAPTPDGAEVGTKWYADVARKVSYVPPSLRDSEALSVLTPLDKGNNLIGFARDHGISLRWTDAPDRIADWDFKTTSSSSIQLAEAAREKWNLPQTSEGARRLASVAESPLRTIQMENAREFVDAQYAFTQASLAEAGYKPDDTVILYRGFGRSYGHGVGNLTSDDNGLWTQGVSVNTRGLSSWSATFDSARSFATPMYDHSYVMAARVKVSDIVSLAGTGLGVTHEREVVVKGGPRTGAIVERNLTTAGPNYDGGSDWYPRERPTAEQHDLEQRYNAWLAKKAHDVSDEARDEHGRWALGSVTAGSIPTYQEGQKAVEDYASTLYDRSGGPYPDPYNGPQLTYEGIANSLDLPALNETRGGEIIAASNGKLSPVEVRAWANAWGRNTGGQEWAALQVATSEKFGVPLGTAEGRVATQAPTRDQIDQARVFVDATYQAAQKILKAQGVDFVDLYRGVGYTDATAPPTYQEAMKDGQAVGSIPNKPLASYAIDPGITEQFGQNYQGLNPALGPGGRPYTLAVRVPRARIFGCAYAGIGVPREGEYVIIGGPTEALVKTRRSRYGN